MRKQLTVLLVAVVALLLILFFFPDAKRPGDGYQKSDTNEEGIPYAAETTFSAKLGEEGKALGVSVTPLAVLEDSRCPVDVQCIQAGTVRLSLHVKSAVAEDTLELRLGGAATSEQERIALIDVVPPPRAGVEIDERDYEFRFSVSTLQGGEF